MTSDFARVFSSLRKERGYSQKKVAKDMGISQALLSHYENGLRAVSYTHLDVYKRQVHE